MCCASHLQRIRAKLSSPYGKVNTTKLLDGAAALDKSEISIGDRVANLVVDLEETILDIINAIEENDKKLAALEKTG